LGLTRHRRGLPELQAVGETYAREFVATWQPRQADLERQLGEPFLFLADEFFIKGGVAFPPLETYGDLPQLENGVGMVPLFLSEAAEVLADAEVLPHAAITVVTGMSAWSYVADFTRELSENTGVKITCLPVQNRLFGEQVTVSGLVTGEDICGALQGKLIGDALFVPDVMLKEGEGVFLDDMSLTTLAERLSCRIEVFAASPHGFYDALLNLLDQ
jgi:NifB/MoaA-like Fe-S oxidoreductase